MGSILVLSAFAALKGGFYQYFIVDLLLSSAHRVYTLGYFFSIIVSLYVSLVLKSYMLTFGAMILEIVFLMYFICASFPGGHTGLNYLGSMVCSVIKKFLRFQS